MSFTLTGWWPIVGVLAHDKPVASQYSAQVEDLVAITPHITVKLLFKAYTSGCFPWSGRPARWYCPDPRSIFEFETIHFSRRLLREIRQEKYRVTYDQAFRQVMEACVEAHPNSWIDQEIVDKFTRFHEQGYAHSVEVWDSKELVGGLYGTHIKGMYAGESMFSRRRNTSKIAFYHLVQKLKTLKVELFDSQVLSPHTASLGAFNISRAEFLRRLRSVMQGEQPLRHDWSQQDEDGTV